VIIKVVPLLWHVARSQQNFFIGRVVRVFQIRVVLFDKNLLLLFIVISLLLDIGLSLLRLSYFVRTQMAGVSFGAERFF
jgi:hypothetical protein